MSGAPARLGADDPVLDDGVLDPGPILEFNGAGAVARHGGVAVLPWRRDHLDAVAAGCPTVAAGADLPAAAHAQAVVRIGKGRAATAADLHQAWRALAPRGRLLVAGGNDLGIGGWVRRLRDALAQDPLIVANRAHGRVALFHRDAGAGPGPVEPAVVPAEPDASAGHLVAMPGAFSGDGLDGGTALLIARLADRPPAGRIADLGCGSGHLAIAALRRNAQSTAQLLDGDARALAGARANLARLGLGDRAEARWWDVSEPIDGVFDLILCNPPAHQGVVVGLADAVRMLRAAGRCLAGGGRMLVVANTRLPYEAELTPIGAVRQVATTRGFKVLEVMRG